MNRPSQHEQTATDAAREAYETQLQTAAGALVAAIRAGVTDGAETISHLLATAAANLGGIHTLTAARPGSWEAHYVDQFLASTVGPNGEYLLQYRTAPIEVVECVEALLADLDIAWLYDDSFELIDRNETEATTTTARAAGDEEAELAEAAGARLDEAYDLIEHLRDSDYAAYRAAFETQLAAAADELRSTRHLPAGVPVRAQWVELADRSQATAANDNAWGTVEYHLWETARLRTAPPGFTEPLEELTGPHNLGELLRSAGRMPHQRIPELARYAHLTTELLPNGLIPTTPTTPTTPTGLADRDPALGAGDAVDLGGGDER